MMEMDSRAELPACIAKFISHFEDLKSADPGLIPEIYHEGVVFEDPIHRVETLSSLDAYFNKLNANLVSGGFAFKAIDLMPGKCYLEWEMKIEPGLCNRKPD